MALPVNIGDIVKLGEMALAVYRKCEFWCSDSVVGLGRLPNSFV